MAGARYGAKASVLGPMMKACALGAIVQVPIFVYFLSTDLPSLYPCVDLFLAPFMTQISNSVHTSLRQQGLSDDIETFLATFFVLNAVGLLTTALANVAASKFKLANLGSYLPYSVICGFFSYVGLTLWMLAIAVDTGHTWDVVLFSGDGALFKKALVHHIPGVVVGVCMRFFGQIFPPLTPLAVLFTIGAGYVIMYSTGTTFEAAVAEGWFYSRDDFIYEKQNAQVGFVSWAPPAPFGILPALFCGTINFQALVSALPHALGMAAIYLLRCSLHAAALRKSTTSMIRAKSSEPPTLPAPPSAMHKRERSVSDAAFEPLNDDKSNESNVKPPTGMTVILLWYGICLAIGGVIGGVGVLPGVAVGAMLFKLGAGGIAPQHGGSLLLFGFYISNFALVRYIPKPAFTCLLIMCSLDMIIDWFIDSFKKTRSVWEWIVCPVIVVFSFLLGQLMAVAVGVALSTFIFVGHMNQSGVVKFLANGLTVRSTIERGEDVADFLDQNGDLIQILVLQNYLFFGNATSVDQYVQTMFEDVRDENVEFDLPPIPKYLLIDFTIVTGIDTSAVDVFSDIISLCKSNGCDILMTGLSSNLRTTFAAAGVKPTRGLRFLPDIEAALGKAEDALVRHIFKKEEKSKMQAVERTRQRLMSVDDDGFRFALRQIDKQHGVSFAEDLEALQKFTKPIELEPGETLFGDDSEFDEEEDRGVFFIESGYMKVERDPTYTMTRGSKASLRRKIGPGIACQRVAGEGGSISHLNARSATIGREAAILKATTGFRSRTSHTFRLARIGPGWVVGAIEGASGLRNPGVHVAVTGCRLHHLPFSSAQELERTNPLLVLRLFKMMSHIMSRRQEMTIEQLATLHSIMTSPASTKPVSRLTMGAIQSAMSYQ